MITYIITFIISIVLLGLSDKVKITQRKFVVFFALIIPCLLAGLRAETIGTDILEYLKPLYKGAESSNNFLEYMNYSWFHIWKYNYVAEYEIGFSLLVYITEKIFRSIFATQFFIQVLTIVPIYMGLKMNKTMCKTWIGMLVYFLLLYNFFLNAMRQGIAIAFLFLAMQYVFIGNWKKYILFQIIAVLFHSSAIIGIIIVLIYYFLHPKQEPQLIHNDISKNNNMVWIRMWIMIGVGISILFVIPSITNLLNAIKLSKYAGYISGDIHFMPNQIISRLPMLILFLIFLKRLVKKDSNVRFLFVMFCFELICSQFTSVNAFSGRIAVYFSAFNILSYPTICKIKTNTLHLAKWITIAYMLFYWWYYFVYAGVNETVPYIFGAF